MGLVFNLAYDKLFHLSKIKVGESHILKFGMAKHYLFAFQAEVIATTGLSVPDGLAVDWVTKNIYFAESAARLIYVCNSNDSFRSTLISTDIQMPRGLAIDPRDG